MPTSTTNIVVELLDGGVATVTLSRPDAMNALTVELVQELGAVLGGLEHQGVRAAVLAGEGRCFCAGADLALVRSALEGDAAAALAPLVDNLHQTLRVARRLPFPLVAALEGPAVGAGMGLALSADLRVASESAQLVPGYLAIGASPDGGVSYALTRAVGGARALSLILRNQTLRADELVALGLAEEVVPKGQATPRAVEVARSVAGAPPMALLRTRALVDRATTNDFDQQLDLERELVSQLWETHDFPEGVRAFLEKRTPAFEGR
jgi:2-(1,2-epoxy-1,2-dihydrophenyl)acetyl-CoA isomerase